MRKRTGLSRKNIHYFIMDIFYSELKHQLTTRSSDLESKIEDFENMVNQEAFNPRIEDQYQQIISKHLQEIDKIKAMIDIVDSIN